MTSVYKRLQVFGYSLSRSPRRLALLVCAPYHQRAVKQPFVNLEEKIDRSVGRRTRTPDSLKNGMQLQAAGVEFHRAFNHRWMAKGIYRFKTHEEADQWMMKMLAKSDLKNP
jgi:hypothetical protein